MMFLKLWKNWVNLQTFTEKVFLRKKFFCLLDKIFGRKNLTKKKEFWKKTYFSEKGNVSGNQCWQNEDFIRLEHKENFTLIMWEIRSPIKGKEMSWESWEKTSIIGRLLFNNEFDNLDQQPTWESTARDNQCFYALPRRYERQSVASFSTMVTATRNSPTEWPLRRTS